MSANHRGLDDHFLESFNSGLLHPLLNLVRRDNTLSLEIRNNYVNICYRGGALFKIDYYAGQIYCHFDLNYLDREQRGWARSLPGVLESEAGVQTWLAAIPHLKHSLDLFLGSGARIEPEFRQLMERENNFEAADGLAQATDYFICDTGYITPAGRTIDLVAARWPSSPGDPAMEGEPRLAFIELRYGDSGLKGGREGETGIIDSVRYLDEMLDAAAGKLDDLCQEMANLFNQKRYLGLVSARHDLAGFGAEPPEMILALCNHDPEKGYLREALVHMPPLRQLDLKVAVSTFFGYGLFKENLYSLDEFQARFGRQIAAGYYR